MKKKLSFKMIYIVYVSVLVLLVALATLYVSRLLKKYEDTMPEQYVKNAYEELVDGAKEGTLWQQYFLPEFETGEYEKGLDVQKTYEKMLTECTPDIAMLNVECPEDELYYAVFCDGAKVAEAKLKAKGPAVTKLAILSYREWDVEYLKPFIEKCDYSLCVPEDFTVKANGISLHASEHKKNANGDIEYIVEDVYFAPEFEIKDAASQMVSYHISENKVVAEYYYYKLLLPDTISVTVNQEKITGTAREDHMVYYEVKELIKPEVILADLYGNTFSYEGGKNIPLTHKAIVCESGCEISVAGEKAPKESMFTEENPEYEVLKEYVPELPQLTYCNVAVLQEDVLVAVTDAAGKKTELTGDETQYSFTAQDKYLDAVPTEVGAEVDVLDIAQKWSLFMSADLTFDNMAKHLIKDSYQYEVAVKYATGIDIKFISGHGLASPPFTEESVTNFVWISDNCFSVDISFVKNMVLNVGTKVSDPMNDRFYFVKYDDTDDGVSNPAWKIASMKEIVEHAE